MAAPARADIADGLAEVLTDVTATFRTGNFPTGFTVLDGGSRGSGFLYSNTSHGSLDFQLFPTSPAYSKSTASTGDSENSHNAVQFGYVGIFPSAIWISGGLTNSESEAASLGGLAHSADSHAYTTVWQILNVTRNPGSGIAPPPIFNVATFASAGALHLRATKEGNANALASIDLTLVGKIKNNNIAGSQPEDLVSKVITANSILANDERFSGPIDQLDHLDLPDWTRLSGASFQLELGLQLDLFTHAEVVPEPATFMALGLGAAFLLRRRARR